MKMKRLGLIASIGVLASAAGIVIATPAQAQNECASKAQINFVSSYMRTMDPSLGCNFMATQYYYSGPLGSGYMANFYYDVPAGVWKVGSARNTPVEGRACTHNTVDNCTYSSWWTTSLQYTFG